jgi:hypothetical protein
VRKLILGSVAVLLTAGLTACAGGTEENAAADEVVADEATPTMDDAATVESEPAGDTTSGDQTGTGGDQTGGDQTGGDQSDDAQ